MMDAKFISPLSVALMDEKPGYWKLNEKLGYVSALVGAVEVPAGYETDFASVPRLPVVYLMTGNTTHKAAVIHDYLYSRAEVDRATADRVYLEACEASGVPAWRRRLMYWGVRIGGGSHYGVNDAA